MDILFKKTECKLCFKSIMSENLEIAIELK